MKLVRRVGIVLAIVSGGFVLTSCGGGAPGAALPTSHTSAPTQRAAGARTTTTTTTPGIGGLRGSFTASTPRTYHFLVTYAVTLGTPYTHSQQDPPSTGTILLPVHGSATLRNTTAGHDAAGQHIRVGVVGAFMSTRPVCATSSAPEALQRLTVTVPVVGKACLILVAQATLASGTLASGASTAVSIAPYDNAAIPSEYPATATPMTLKAATVQSVLADIERGPTAWLVGALTAGYFGLTPACSLTPYRGFFIGSGFGFVQFTTPPSDKAQSSPVCTGSPPTTTSGQ